MRKILVLFSLLHVITGHAKPAPHFTAEWMTGGRAQFSELKKEGRGLLLCFWATWCAPCLQELKSVSEAMKANPNLNLDVVTINVDTSETSSDVKPTVKLYKFDLPIALDPKHEIFSKYQDQKMLPFSVLVGVSGNVELTFNGYQEEMFKKIREVLEKKGEKANDPKPAVSGS